MLGLQAMGDEMLLWLKSGLKYERDFGRMKKICTIPESQTIWRSAADSVSSYLGADIGRLYILTAAPFRKSDTDTSDVLVLPFVMTTRKRMPLEDAAF